MSNIDYQNGFLCGMATKGLVISGEEYEPKVWNDDGIYTYFYIDFLRAVMDFSTGMLKGSFIVYDSIEVPITGFERVDLSVFKIFADIADKPLGITITNKATSLLVFTSGRKVPPFSIHMYVLGQAPFVRKAYAYDETTVPSLVDWECIDTRYADIHFQMQEWGAPLEVENMVYFDPTITEYDPVISYWAV